MYTSTHTHELNYVLLVAIARFCSFLDRSRWVPLNLSRLPRSAICGSSPEYTDVFLCYQRLRVSCALCNNFQAARPRQTTERRLAPLYDKSIIGLVPCLIISAVTLQVSRMTYFVISMHTQAYGISLQTSIHFYVAT